MDQLAIATQGEAEQAGGASTFVKCLKPRSKNRVDSVRQTGSGAETLKEMLAPVISEN